MFRRSAPSSRYPGSHVSSSHKEKEISAADEQGTPPLMVPQKKARSIGHDILIFSSMVRQFAIGNIRCVQILAPGLWDISG